LAIDYIVLLSQTLKENVLIRIFIYILFLTNLLSLQAQTVLDMESAVLLGIRNNALLRVLHSKKEISTLLEREKWREFLPKVGVTYFGLKGLNQNQTDSVYNDLRLTLQQMVYDGGENSRNIDIAKLTGFLYDSDFQFQSRKLVLDIRKAYLKALSSLGKSFMANRALDRATLSYKETKLAYDKGLKTRFEVLDAKAKLHALQLAFRKANSDSKNLLLELKILLSLDTNAEISFSEDIFFDLFIFPPDKFNLEFEKLAKNRPEFKKASLVLEKAKIEKENYDNHFKPKLFVGAYYGKNSNDKEPVKHEAYGWNFSLVLPLGSSTSRTDSNFGVQTDGTGIQRVQGFGPQYVGQGENSFSNSSLSLFDNLSYSRKILEGEIQVSEAAANLHTLQSQIQLEIEKSKDKMNETYLLITSSNSKLLVQLEILRLTQVKFKIGMAKASELISAETEFLKSEEDLADSITEYSKTSFEYLYALGTDDPSLRYIEHRPKKGNSIFAKIFNKDGSPDFTKAKELGEME
jgi:outer membrane protein TolC